MDFNRRKFISGAASVAAIASLPLSIKNALAISPSGSTLSAVKHVVIFMQENRSFDHYFGNMKGVRGYGDKSPFVQVNGQTVFNQAGTLPFRLDTGATKAQCSYGLDHSWNGGHSAWNNGKYNNWVAAKGKNTMGYFTRSEIPFHYALADAFTVCDQYFCSVMGATNPNRLYSMTGTIDPQGLGGGPIIDNTEPPAGFKWTTYPERLQAAGVSWKIYQKTSDNYDDNALAWFTSFKNAAPGTPLYDRAMKSVPNLTNNTVNDVISAVKADVLNGTLPQVSWVLAPEIASEHPNHAPAAGADMMSKLLSALTADPNVWASTVFIINYDENDGYFDHVLPPSPPAGTPDEFVNGTPIGLGARVPMIVASPWSTGGNVCSQVFDHTSVLRFLEVWTGVQEPNISAWRRKLCGDLTSALDFSSTSLTVPAMPNTATALAAANSQCSSSLPYPAAPTVQSMPIPESGTKPARALPYQPNATSSIEKSAGRFWIEMSNTGSQAVHYAIAPNAYRTDAPYHYDVSPNIPVKDYFSVQSFGAGKYDLSTYAPNGFLRRFVGDINGAGAIFEITSSYNFSLFDQAQLILTMVNTGTVPIIVTVKSNAYRGDGPWTYTVAPGATVSDFWNTEWYTENWYDFTATINIDSLFLRRFAGHIELSTPSVTG